MLRRVNSATEQTQLSSLIQIKYLIIHEQGRYI